MESGIKLTNSEDIIKKCMKRVNTIVTMTFHISRQDATRLSSSKSAPTIKDIYKLKMGDNN